MFRTEGADPGHEHAQRGCGGRQLALSRVRRRPGRIVFLCAHASHRRGDDEATIAGPHRAWLPPCEQGSVTIIADRVRRMAALPVTVDLPAWLAGTDLRAKGMESLEN